MLVRGGGTWGDSCKKCGARDGHSFRLSWRCCSCAPVLAGLYLRACSRAPSVCAFVLAGPCTRARPHTWHFSLSTCSLFAVSLFACWHFRSLALRALALRGLAFCALALSVMIILAAKIRTLISFLSLFLSTYPILTFPLSPISCTSTLWQ